MKIIQVVGRSGSGKTTFIRKLCEVLQEKGRVGTIKHLGHHTFGLTPGKDTTLFFETGIDASVGIDDEKTVTTVRSLSVHHALCSLADMGIDYCIIEGFKQNTYSRIVIGDLASDALLKNPTVSDITGRLSEFDDFFTLASKTCFLQNPGGNSSCQISFLFTITGPDSPEHDSRVKAVTASLTQKQLQAPVFYLYPVYCMDTEQPYLGVIIDCRNGIEITVVDIVLSNLKRECAQAGLSILTRGSSLPENT